MKEEDVKNIFDNVEKLLALQEPDKAIVLLEQAIKELSEDQVWLLGRSYFWLQLCYKQLLNLKAGVEAGKKAIKYYEKIGDRLQISNVLKDTASLYEHLGKYEQALKYLNESLEEIEDQKVLHTLGIILAKKGKLLSQIGDDYGAEINLLAAEQVIDCTNNLMHRLTVSTHLMELYTRLQKYDEASFYAKKSEKLLKDLKDEKGYLNEIRYTQIQLARSVIAQGKGKTKEAVMRLRNFVKFGIKRKKRSGSLGV